VAVSPVTFQRSAETPARAAATARLASGAARTTVVRSWAHARGWTETPTKSAVAAARALATARHAAADTVSGVLPSPGENVLVSVPDTPRPTRTNDRLPPPSGPSSLRATSAAAPSDENAITSTVDVMCIRHDTVAPMEIPTDLGAFRVGARLGAGGQGEVFAARHLATGLAVAIKLHAAGAEVPLDHELQAIAGLDHPHIVRLWGTGVIDGRRWLAMELATGTLVSEPPGDWPALREVALHVASALAHAHARDVLHLDVKPGNLLVGCADGADELRARVPGLRLSDFGLSRTVGDRRRILGGTPGWMAPEQRRGEADRLGPETDLYALAATLWALASGAPPSDAADGFHPRFPVPPAFGAWLAWLLDPEPSRRPQRAAEAIRGLPDDGVDGEVARSTQPEALDGATLTDFDALTDFGTLDGVLEARVHVAPTWEDWRQPEAWGRVRWLTDGGLGPTAARWPRFVGREAERDRLWTLFGEVRAAQRQAVVVLQGPCGVGTSRLASWFGGRLHELDLAQTLTVAHTAARGPDEGAAAAVRRLTSTGDRRGWSLHRRLSEVARGLPGSTPAMVEGLQELVTGDGDGRALLTLAPVWAERPLVVLVDDAAHGPETVALARFALEARTIAPAAVLFVLVTSDAASVSAGLGQDAPTIELGPLSLRELDVLTRDWMGLAASAADHVVAGSDGLPGRVVSHIARLEREGALTVSPRGFTLASPGASPPPPEPVEALLRAVTGGLRADLARVVAVESLGRVVAALPPDHPTRGAHAAAALELEAVRGRLAEALDRAAQLVADADRHAWPRPGARAAELRSWMLHLRSDAAEAERWAAEAAARYAQLGDEDAAARVQVRRGQLLLDTRPDLVAAIAEPLSTGPVRTASVTALVLLGQAHLAVGRAGEAVGCGERALATLRTLGRADLEDRVLRELARFLSLAGRHAEAGEHARSAVDAARRSNNGASLAFATAVWADVRRRAGDLPGALASYLEVAELCERSGVGRGDLDGPIGGTLLLQGHVAEAAALLDREPPRALVAQAVRQLLHTAIALHQGHFREARAAWAAAATGPLVPLRRHAEVVEWEGCVVEAGRATGLIRDLSDLD
jgi:tetratricopeptide (TPR) repeat protein